MEAINTQNIKEKLKLTNDTIAYTFITTAIIMFSSIYWKTTMNPNYEVLIRTNAYGEHWIEVIFVALGIMTTIILLTRKDE